MAGKTSHIKEFPEGSRQALIWHQPGREGMDDADTLWQAIYGLMFRTHNQHNAVAASVIAFRNTLGHLAQRIATCLQSFSRPNIISIRLRGR